MKKSKIPWGKPRLEINDLKHLQKAFKSTWISGGPYVEKFEDLLKRFCEGNDFVVTSSGTASIHLSYLAVGLKSGDEIIVPGYGYLAAANIAKLLEVPAHYHKRHTGQSKSNFLILLFKYTLQALILKLKFINLKLKK